jgi:hypothetical protein
MLLPGLASSQNCKALPNHYSSYDQAIQAFKTHSFKVDEQDYSQSSWISHAEYKSCDGIKGYFLLSTGNMTYIFAGMPINVWNEYKSASSKGRYYNEYIKGRYQFNL